MTMQHVRGMGACRRTRGGANPFGQGPKHLIRDNDHKYGVRFATVAAGAQIDVITTPYQAPRANAVCERFVGSVRRECLDWLLIRVKTTSDAVFRLMSTTSTCNGPIKR